MGGSSGDDWPPQRRRGRAPADDRYDQFGGGAARFRLATKGLAGLVGAKANVPTSSGVRRFVGVVQCVLLEHRWVAVATLAPDALVGDVPSVVAEDHAALLG